MISKKNASKGFTLIELLVVVAIISLLSSIVMASLSTARLKAKDSVVKQGVRQLANVFELEYNDKSSYLNLQPRLTTWYYNSANCNDVANFTNGSTYAANARQICVNIVAAGGSLHVGNTHDLAAKFSIMAYLPGTDKYFCLGSSGANTEVILNAYTLPGCWQNP